MFNSMFIRALLLSLGLVLTVQNLLASTGADIYENKCASCHSNNEPNSAIPILHGQEPNFIIMALKAFKSNERKDHIMDQMNAIAASLSEEDMAKVAKHVATLEPCDIKFEIDYKRAGFKEEFLAGKAKMTEKNCMHCHGNFHHFAPKINGQRHSYLAKSIEAFKSGERNSPLMKRMLEPLNDDDIKNILTYFSGLKLMRSCVK